MAQGLAQANSNIFTPAYARLGAVRRYQHLQPTFRYFHIVV